MLTKVLSGVILLLLAAGAGVTIALKSWNTQLQASLDTAKASIAAVSKDRDAAVTANAASDAANVQLSEQLNQAAAMAAQRQKAMATQYAHFTARQQRIEEITHAPDAEDWSLDALPESVIRLLDTRPETGGGGENAAPVDYSAVAAIVRSPKDSRQD